MHRNLKNLALAFSLAIIGALTTGAAQGAETHHPIGYPCSDTAEAKIWEEYFRADFTGLESHAMEFRAEVGLQVVDSAAVVGPVAEADACSAIAAAATSNLQVKYPYRLVMVRFGPYYAVAVVDTTPNPPGVEVIRRSLVLILDAATLAIIADNILA